MQIHPSATVAALLTRRLICGVNHQENMNPTISESHTESSVNVKGIVDRIDETPGVAH
jgi:hypothetical protein